MFISKKLLLISLMVSGAFYATDRSNPVQFVYHTNLTPVHSGSREITKTIIYRAATDSEEALAEFIAAQQLSNANKTGLQKLGESFNKEMNYLYNAQPFGVEHGFVKGTGVVAGALAAAYLYKLYQDYRFDRAQRQK